MPLAKASEGERSSTGAPSIRMVPLVGCTLPAKIFTSVLLPAPFLPISAWTLPPSKSTETPFSATVPGYSLRRFSVWR